MRSKEFNAAARERVQWIKDNLGTTSKWSIHDYRDFYARDMEALVPIADAYLQEHPSDDDEPVTEEWLGSSVIASTQRVSYVFAELYGWTLQWCPQCGDLPPIITINSLAIIWNPTRGDVRRLFAALGIPSLGGTQG